MTACARPAHPYQRVMRPMVHNVIDQVTGWELDSNQLLIKLQYAFRY